MEGGGARVGGSGRLYYVYFACTAACIQRYRCSYTYPRLALRQNNYVVNNYDYDSFFSIRQYLLMRRVWYSSIDTGIYMYNRHSDRRVWSRVTGVRVVPRRLVAACLAVSCA
jgi:hypothetical protein